MSFLAILLATFLHEDITCISVGLLIREGRVDRLVGVLACFTGIFIGDLGLWLIGRLFGRRLLRTRWIAARLHAERMEQLATWFNRRGWQLVVAARFVPGTRFPVFLAAGILGRSAWQFALIAMLAATVWTPMLVLGSAWLGKPVVESLRGWLGSTWLAIGLAVVLIMIALYVVERMATPIGRAQLIATVSRLWRWEFWPQWVFYIPVVPWIAWLVLRHRSLMAPTAANPAIPHSGIVGESKYDILSRLPSEWIVPTALIPAGRAADDDSGDVAAERLELLRRLMMERGWSYPLILKPDAGERGAGVRLVRDDAAAAAYLQRFAVPIVAQVYHPGPHEAGVFYVRLPSEQRGRIFSITDKAPPVLTGDGQHTFEQLIWRHPRFRMQAHVFLDRFADQADRVLDRGEELRLAVAGNHCQGTLFRDGGHLLTPALETAIDAIARQFEGFFFGRFDLRYADVAALRAGRDFRIVELNGALSESTNIYDPARSLLWAYGTLFRQWWWLYEIGAANAARGARVSSWGELRSDMRRYYQQQQVAPNSD